MMVFRFAAMLCIFLLVGVQNAFAAEWYEGGTLSGKNLLEWQDGSFENKIATSADMVAAMLENKFFTPSHINKIASIDDLKPYALDLALCIETSSPRYADTQKNNQMYVNQKVAERAVMCATLMGWGSIPK